ncbi:unnamed protein product [Heligmosomoides polygyrus]|uniref:DNL-type domain-containing protein n=1 Tax=Heligmosomoides polygyrus TaxID=6339 RepID=A0A183GHT8_HELPZ|nr:unnamed protein product [Heligmosomoides polygyrus]
MHTTATSQSTSTTCELKIKTSLFVCAASVVPKSSHAVVQSLRRRHFRIATLLNSSSAPPSSPSPKPTPQVGSSSSTTVAVRCGVCGEHSIVGRHMWTLNAGVSTRVRVDSGGGDDEMRRSDAALFSSGAPRGSSSQQQQ